MCLIGGATLPSGLPVTFKTGETEELLRDCALTAILTSLSLAESILAELSCFFADCSIALGLSFHRFLGSQG